MCVGVRTLLACALLVACVPTSDAKISSPAGALAPEETPNARDPYDVSAPRGFVVDENGRPYRGCAQWCLIVDMPDCSESGACLEAWVDGEYWIKMDPSCDQALEGNLSFHADERYRTVFLNKETFQVRRNERLATIVLTKIDYGEMSPPARRSCGE
jgi:hypothetical protein